MDTADILVQLFFLGNFLGAWLFLFTAGFMSWHKPWGISLPQSTWYWELANCFQVFLKARLGSDLLANWPPAVTHLFSLFFFFLFFVFCFCSVLPLVKKLEVASFKKLELFWKRGKNIFLWKMGMGTLWSYLCYQAAGGWALGKGVRVQG